MSDHGLAAAICAFVAGEDDRGQRARLEAACRADPALVDEIRDHLAVANLLAVRRERPSAARLHARVLHLVRMDETGARRRTVQQVRQRMARGTGRRSRRRARSPAAPLVLALAAAAVLVLALVLTVLARRDPPAPSAPLVEAPVPTPVPTGSPVVAAVDGMVLVDGSAVVLGQELAVGGILTTADTGGATLRYTDGSTLELAVASRLVITSGTVRARLERGALRCAVSPQGPSGFALDLPHGRVRVLGTRFACVGDDRRSRVAVDEGRVRLKRGDDELELAAGDIAEASSDGLHRLELLAAGDPPRPGPDWRILDPDRTRTTSAALVLRCDGTRRRASDPAWAQTNRCYATAALEPGSVIEGRLAVPPLGPDEMVTIVLRPAAQELAPGDPSGHLWLGLRGDELIGEGDRLETAPVAFADGLVHRWRIEVEAEGLRWYVDGRRVATLYGTPAAWPAHFGLGVTQKDETGPELAIHELALWRRR